MKWASVSATYSAIVFACVVFAACGGDVDLGGTSGSPCEPCSSASTCRSGSACAVVGGNGFCATLCPQGNECGADETCSAGIDTTGAATRACLPSSGTCPAPPSPSIDGAAVDHCGSLVGPNVSASCRACSKTSPTCQPNGCYGGYWCNTKYDDCNPPPKTCS